MTRPDLLGKHITRRGLLIGGGVALISARGMSATPSCTMTSEEVEGPYYVDDRLMRRDVTEGLPGVPLKLRVQIMDAKRCMPVANAALDIWHCDADGYYSGYSYVNPDIAPPPAPRAADGSAQHRPWDRTRFLRGVQISDKNGMVEFETLYPGWYYGRAIHIHARVHIAGATAAGKYNGGHAAHTGQFYFPEEITTEVAKVQPYQKRIAVARLLTQNDNFYLSSNGQDSILTLDRLKKNSVADGFLATITVGIDPEATPKPVSMQQPQTPRARP